MEHAVEEEEGSADWPDTFGLAVMVDDVVRRAQKKDRYDYKGEDSEYEEMQELQRNEKIERRGKYRYRSDSEEDSDSSDDDSE